MASINPQGYILGGDPVNVNPFWDDEDSGSSGSSSESGASSEELEALETRVETLEEETATIKTEVGELGDELNELNGEVNTLTTQVETNTENIANLTTAVSEKVTNVTVTTDSETSEDYETHTIVVSKDENEATYTIETVKPSSYEALSEDVAENTNDISTMIDANGGEVGQVWTVLEDGTGGWANFPNGLIQYTYDTDTGETTAKIIKEASSGAKLSYVFYNQDIADFNNKNLVSGGTYAYSYIFYGSSSRYMKLLNPPETLIFTNLYRSLWYLYLDIDLNVDITTSSSYSVPFYHSKIYSGTITGTVTGTSLGVFVFSTFYGGDIQNLTYTGTEYTEILTGSTLYTNVVLPTVSAPRSVYTLANVACSDNAVIDARKVEFGTFTTTTSYSAFSGTSASPMNIILPDFSSLPEYGFKYLNTLYCSEAMFNILVDNGLTQVESASDTNYTYVTWVNTDESGWADDLDGIEE